MHKAAVYVARLACLVVMTCFFFSYFVVSCNGQVKNITGVDAAFGVDRNEKPDKPLEIHPPALLVPCVALMVLALLGIFPAIGKRQEYAKFPVKAIPVIGGIIGLLALAFLYYDTYNTLKAELQKLA